MIGYTRISKKAFYAYGGFSNPRFCRVTRKGDYAYFERNIKGYPVN